MDTVPTLRPATDDTYPAPRPHLELTWTLQHIRGQEPALTSRWIVTGPDTASRAAA